jgi:hypothetical protein
MAKSIELLEFGLQNSIYNVNRYAFYCTDCRPENIVAMGRIFRALTMLHNSQNLLLLDKTIDTLHLLPAFVFLLTLLRSARTNIWKVCCIERYHFKPEEAGR